MPFLSTSAQSFLPEALQSGEASAAEIAAGPWEPCSRSREGSHPRCGGDSLGLPSLPGPPLLRSELGLRLRYLYETQEDPTLGQAKCMVNIGSHCPLGLARVDHSSLAGQGRALDF